MDLQISVFLLFSLFTAGHSLNCSTCGLTGSCTVKRCSSGSSCMTLTLTPVEFITEVKIKDCATACQSWSKNLGVVKVTSSCCNTDLCDPKDAPDPSNVPNGKTCYSCDGQNCTVSCSGTEDRCITATGNFGSKSVVVKGCVPKFICDATSLIPYVDGVTCCEGNLCNGAPSDIQSSTVNSVPSVSQSFLFLCCSLLSYFLLH